MRGRGFMGKLLEKFPHTPFKTFNAGRVFVGDF